MYFHHALQPPRNARVLFIDMNGFFASVEQQDNPTFRNRPVAVASNRHPRGTVVASSYEAKAKGVTTGTKVGDARRLCPGLIVVEGSHRRYKEVHQAFMAILRDLCGPEVQAKSIDEAAVYLSPNWQSSAQAYRLALTIKERFRETLGPYIRCSIGIAPNTLLAKLATELYKPDGLFEITLENTIPILQPLELTDLTGIAEQMAKRVRAAGLLTPLDLYHTSPDQLRAYFGIWGQYWWWRLHGYECDIGRDSLKSMSHEHVLPRWVHHKTELTLVVDRMAERLLNRLVRNGLQCQHIWLAVKFAGGPSLMRERRLDAPSHDVAFLLRGYQRLLAEAPEELGLPARKVVLGMHGLVANEWGDQLDLFSPSHPTGVIVGQLMHQIKERFGSDAIRIASGLSLDRKMTLKETTGFGRIKDV